LSLESNREPKLKLRQQGLFCYADYRINPDRHIAYQLQSQLHEHNQALEYNLRLLSLLSDSSRL